MKRMDKRYIPGDRWVTCEDCGFYYRFSQMRRGVTGKQKGLEICPDCFDMVHPNEKFKPKSRKEGILEKVR